MGNDTKWADVAHYYQKSGVILQRNRRPELVCKFLYTKGFLLYGISETIGDIIWPFDECTPILRHRDDMTDAEVLECIKCGWPVVAGKPIKEFACIPDHSEFGSAFTYKIVFDGSPHYMAGTLSFRSLDSNQFIWLISRGFDMFGLIESGQAIRKEAGNGL